MSNKAPLTLSVGLAVLLTFSVSGLFFSQSAAAQAVVSTADAESKFAGDFVVPLNKSQVLRLDVPFADLLVGNPEIADVLALTDRSIYVLGKSVGSTSLTIRAEDSTVVAVVDLTVNVDVEGLKTRLFEMMPNERIEVRAVGGSAVLSGVASSASALSRALSLAEKFAPENVTNLVSVEGSQQVMLEVRFVEVSRTLAKDLGLNTNIANSDFAFTAGDAFLSGLISATSFATGALTFDIGSVTFDFLFDALEEKGVVKTLAEPNLIAMSGDTASFLAGGEFPVPVAQDTDSGGVAITVEFKEFGVSLSFTPTVLGNNLINVAVAPEVSRIDEANSVTLNGFNIPGLATRRASTTVELRDGEAFAIAGLLQNDFRDTVRQFPGLGDVPVLGSLLRSSGFQRAETELVIIVAPHLVRPAPAGTLATPADGLVLPNEIDLFLFGRTEGLGSGALERSSVAPLAAEIAGGIDGPYGHIIK